MVPGDEDPGGGGGGGGGGAPEQACEEASDCELAASTCCECPSFAAPIQDGFGNSCEDVECPPSDLCPAVMAVCAQEQCQMVCAPLEVTQTCVLGFARDAAGCLLDACQTASLDVLICEQDSDCTQIPADCCGCSQGGRDQAALTADAAEITVALDCSGEEICPDVNVCDSEAAPKCFAGACFLTQIDVDSSLDDGEEELCGTPALGPCAQNSRCLVNQVPGAEVTEIGVGICVTP